MVAILITAFYSSSKLCHNYQFTTKWGQCSAVQSSAEGEEIESAATPRLASVQIG